MGREVGRWVGGWERTSVIDVEDRELIGRGEEGVGMEEGGGGTGVWAAVWDGDERRKRAVWVGGWVVEIVF